MPLRAAVALLAALLLAGCYRGPGPVDDDRVRSFTLEQVGAAEDGLSTFRLTSRAPMVTLDDVRVVVDGEPLLRAPACPPPELHWAWCGDEAVRAGDTLQARAASGSTLRLVDLEAGSVMLTLAVR